MKPTPYHGKPEGLSFVGRFPKHSKFRGYGEMVITEDNVLACLCNDGRWYPFRPATYQDILIASTCFKTMAEAEYYFDHLQIAA